MRTALERLGWGLTPTMRQAPPVVVYFDRMSTGFHAGAVSGEHAVARMGHTENEAIRNALIALADLVSPPGREG